MGTNWLVCVDDSVWASYAFNFTMTYLNKESDRVYLMHVTEEPSRIILGYATSSLIEGLNQAEDKKAKKILVHYGHKAKELGVKFTMMKGSDSNPGSLICKAAKNYNISNIVLGRRTLGPVERFIVGSTSKYVLENADVNVIVVKKEFGGPEEHASKLQVIQAEEEERLRRIEEDGPAELHEVAKEEVIKLEEEERQRRILEDHIFSKQNLNKLIHTYQFQEEILHKK
jgi:nucleotide-binding universal stress UspA family protein